MEGKDKDKGDRGKDRKDDKGKDRGKDRGKDKRSVENVVSLGTAESGQPKFFLAHSPNVARVLSMQMSLAQSSWCGKREEDGGVNSRELSGNSAFGLG